MSEVIHPLTSLDPGMKIVFGGDRYVEVGDDLAAAFEPGDYLVVVQDTGDLLHIPSDDWAMARRAVDAAVRAFSSMGSVGIDSLRAFYEAFARRLSDEAVFAAIGDANREDVSRARQRGRSVTRLELTDAMRRDMIEGLRSWAEADVGRGSVVEEIDHEGWSLQQVKAGLGVVGFVFEGRPNVFADATGVLAAGNTVVFRIGSDALGTARAIVDHALNPALDESGLPPGAVSLVDAASHAAGWAMFSDSRLGLAVARGSGSAVSQLGSVARQAGVPVSLHGTGGAWIVASGSADADRLAAAVSSSLDRKVCNTLNTVCIVRERVDDLVPRFLDALERAGDIREAKPKLHVTEAARQSVPDSWFGEVPIVRAEGEVIEPQTEVLSDGMLGHEWEWEDSPEVTLHVVESVDEAVEAFNSQSPRFVASLISEVPAEQDRFFEMIDSPFVGDGFTRWVDGQYAFNKPELGLSNWQFGRLFGRGGVLSGDSVYTLRTRVRQSNPEIRR